MGTLSRLKTLFRKNQEDEWAANTADASGGLPPDDFELPSIALPALGLMLTAGQAQAVQHGEKTLSEAKEVVTTYHQEKIRSAATKVSEFVAGERQKKLTQKIEVEKDILSLEVSIGSGTAGEEVDVEVPRAKLLPDNVELALTALAAFGITVWSVTTNHSFLVNSAIFSSNAAWVAAIGPMVGAWWLKDPLSSHGSDNVRRTLRSTYVGVAVTASVTWVATFGHEAGAAVSALGDLGSAVVVEDHSWRMTIRALSQLFMEICGGSILFYRSFELFRNEGRGKETRKVYRMREKYAYECQERDKKRALLERIETHLSSIDTWFATIPHIEKEYVTRALGLLEQNIATLKGA